MTTARRRSRPEPPVRAARITPTRAVAVLLATAAAALALVVLVVPTSGTEAGASDAPSRATRGSAVPAVHEVATQAPAGSAGAEPASLETGRPPSSPAATTPPAALAALRSTAPPQADATDPPPDVAPAPPASTAPVAAPEPPAVAPEADAAAVRPVWDELADCESGGDWSIDTGNGYYGGLQFSASTWSALGGTGLPHEHPREVQVAVAERLLDSQGWGAWPSCASQLGLR